MLYNGEHIGDGTPPRVDIAVDPIDGTTLTAKGIANAIAVIALSDAGTMFDPGPCVYMEKIAVGPECVGVIDITKSATENLAAVARAKNESIHEVTAVILDRPRHDELIAEVRASGARIRLIQDGDVADRFAFGPGDGFEVLGDAHVEVDDPDALGTDGDLLHVDAGPRVEHGAALADGDDGDGVAPPLRGQRGAVDGVDGDVGGRPGAVTDRFAVEEHGRFVLLALTDDHDAVHGHALERDAHGVDGGAVGAFLVPPTHPAGAGHGGGFGHPDDVEGEVAVGVAGHVGHGGTVVVPPAPGGTIGRERTVLSPRRGVVA